LTGNIPLNDAAIHKALSVDPSTPDTIWNVANFLMAQDDVSEALKQFAVVLQKDPSLVPASLNICWHSVHDVSLIESILPRNPAAYLEFVRVLHASGEYDQAGQVWASLMRMDGDFDYRQFLFYIDDLIQVGRAEQGDQAWRQLSEHSPELHAYDQPGNLVMDGSFAQEILNSGFDWRYIPNAFVDATLDSAESHSGGRSLRLVYSAANVDAGISQYIAVQPHSRYRLSAWVKSEDLRTANGPMLTLFDAGSHMPVAFTQDTIGTTPWHPIEVELTTGPTTNLLVLSIVRNPGQTAIRGKFWINDIRLEPL
jgi:tetratricopeptide (TPR) repeat protein